MELHMDTHMELHMELPRLDSVCQPIWSSIWSSIWSFIWSSRWSPIWSSIWSSIWAPYGAPCGLTDGDQIGQGNKIETAIYICIYTYQISNIKYQISNRPMDQGSSSQITSSMYSRFLLFQSERLLTLLGSFNAIRIPSNQKTTAHSTVALILQHHDNSHMIRKQIY